MIASAKNFRSLLSSCGPYTVGVALLGIILPLRMNDEGFSVLLIGLIMVAYYAGQALGGHFSKKILFRVGHIRAFTVFAAAGAAALLAYDPFFSAPTWFALRLVNGFCFAGMATTIESWLNDHSNSENRGKVLSVYMIVQYLSVAIGQLLINIGSIDQPDLFMLAAALVSLSLIPVAVTRLPEPVLEKYRPFGVRTLFRKCSIGSIGAMTAGMLLGTFYSMGVVFTDELGFSVADVSIFMGMAIMGGCLIQWPVGKLSDLFDRRLVMIGMATLPLIAWLLFSGVGVNTENPLIIFVIAVILGAAIASIYPLSVAYTFDKLERIDYIPASGGLFLFYAIGAVIGPLLATIVMATFGPRTFLGFEAAIATVFCGLVIFNVFRKARPGPLLREPFITVPTPSQVACETD